MRQMLRNPVLRFRYQLRCRRWRGSAQVGNEIAYREIGFMSYRGNHWDVGTGYNTRQTFIVESRKIFNRTAAAGDHDYVNTPVSIEVTHTRRNLGRRCLSLHLRGVKQN